MRIKFALWGEASLCCKEYNNGLCSDLKRGLGAKSTDAGVLKDTLWEFRGLAGGGPQRAAGL